jgi:L-threonylcarbamoyladenylate synthase
LSVRTEIIEVDRESPQPAAMTTAAEVLRRGGLVAFPTETVYGLGANALDASAVRCIFEAKGRPATNPVIVHVASAEELSRVAAQVSELAGALARAFWPGALTLVLPRCAEIPDVVTAGGETVAVRVPNHPVALALLKAAGVPIAAPSANRSESLSPTTAAHVLKGLDGRVDLVLDGGPARGGIESTVLDLSGPEPTILRPGLVTREQIAAVLGVQVALRTAGEDSAELARSPGQMRRHYAPRVPLELSEASAARIAILAAGGVRVGWLALTSDEGIVACGAPVRKLVLPRDPQGYAAGLFAALHALEDAGCQRIVVEKPPLDPEWLAIHDRLSRAVAAE